MSITRRAAHDAPRGIPIVVALAIAAISCVSTSGTRETQNPATSTTADTRVTRQNVQAQLIAFSGRYVAEVLQAAEVLENDLGSPTAREVADRERLAALLMTTEIAAGPEPGTGLLDMTVLVTLKRVVWEEYWAPEVFGAAGQVMVDAFAALESDIWQVGAGVFSPEQLDELRQLIVDWRADNPDQVSVYHLRLAELGNAGRISDLVAASKPGGMLAPVKEASRNIEELRLLGERLAFMLTRLQLAASYQVDFAYSELAMEPEVQRFLDGADTFALAVDRIAGDFSRLVDELPRQREAAIDQLLDDLTSEEKGLRPALSEARETLEIGRQVAELLQETVSTTDRMVERVLEDQTTRPFDILEYQAALIQAAATLEEAQATLAGVEALLESRGLERQLPQIKEGADWLEEEVATDFLNAVFLRGAGLIILFFVGLYLYRAAVVRL